MRDYDNKERAQLSIEGRRINVGLNMNTSLTVGERIDGFNRVNEVITRTTSDVKSLKQAQEIIKKHLGYSYDLQLPEYDHGKTWGDNQVPVGKKYAEIEKTVADMTRAFEAMVLAYLESEKAILDDIFEKKLAAAEKEIKRTVGGSDA